MQIYSNNFIYMPEFTNIEKDLKNIDNCLKNLPLNNKKTKSFDYFDLFSKNEKIKELNAKIPFKIDLKKFRGFKSRELHFFSIFKKKVSSREEIDQLFNKLKTDELEQAKKLKKMEKLSSVSIAIGVGLFAVYASFMAFCALNTLIVIPISLGAIIILGAIAAAAGITSIILILRLGTASINYKYKLDKTKEKKKNCEKFIANNYFRFELLKKLFKNIQPIESKEIRELKFTEQILFLTKNIYQKKLTKILKNKIEKTDIEKSIEKIKPCPFRIYYDNSLLLYASECYLSNKVNSYLDKREIFAKEVLTKYRNLAGLMKKTIKEKDLEDKTKASIERIENISLKNLFVTV